MPNRNPIRNITAINLTKKSNEQAISTCGLLNSELLGVDLISGSNLCKAEDISALREAIWTYFYFKMNFYPIKNYRQNLQTLRKLKMAELKLYKKNEEFLDTLTLSKDTKEFADFTRSFIKKLDEKILYIKKIPIHKGPREDFLLNELISRLILFRLQKNLPISLTTNPTNNKRSGACLDWIAAVLRNLNIQFHSQQALADKIREQSKKLKNFKGLNT